MISMMAAQTADGFEPRFSLPPSTPKSSKTELAIGGLKIYVYGLEEAIASQTADHNGEVAVLYLAHNRTRTYLVTEGIAHEVLHRYREDKTKAQSVPLIAVTMNMRNHGDREICPHSNRTWKDGNEQHAMDLVSLISGSAQDFKLVLDYLPAYLTQFTRFYNVMAGVSLGGHTAWRMASLASPGQIHAYCMVVGCPSISQLLVDRLAIDPCATDDANGQAFNYDSLLRRMNTEQQHRWPRALANIVQAEDRKVAHEFPTDVPLLLCNGVHDKLVPAKHTASWVDKRRHQNKTNGIDQDIIFFVQDNTGHSCTKEMVAIMAVWLRDILPPRSPRSFL